jgi:HD-GYP domain-containing protein (c-di-GMP phosphodiesterase class II)
MGIWLIPVILLVIGEVVLVYYFIIFLMRRRRTIHQRRVAELAGAIAQEMKLSPKLVKMLLMFGVIRDPDLAELPYPVAKTATQYNQRLNSSGYPQKLAGDNILLEARIMAVADMAETMTSPKPHRSAISLPKAMEDLKWSSIALYDTEVVKALTRLVKRGNFKFQTHYI